MPRPPLPIGTWGAINSRKTGAVWRASAQFRGHDGRTRKVSRQGKTRAAAENALRTHLGSLTKMHGSEDINLETTVEELCAQWLADARADGTRKKSTTDEYEAVINRTIVPGLGGVRLREATTGRLDKFIKMSRDAGRLAEAKQVKNILGQAFDLAVQHDAIPVNPVRSTSRLAKPKKEVRALHVDQLPEVYALIHAWQTKPRPGPKVSEDLADVMTVALGTGARIGEVLGLRWSDIDEVDGVVYLTLRGTVVSPRKKGAGPTTWQPDTKSRAGFRRLFVPPFVVEVLNKRRERYGTNPIDAVFPSKVGTWKSPHNVRANWRDARRGSAFEWVTPHTMRKTVATAVSDEHGKSEAKQQLGHSSETITENHYIQAPASAPDLTGTLERLGQAFSAPEPTDPDEPDTPDAA